MSARAARGLARCRRRAGFLPGEAEGAGGEPREAAQVLRDAFEDAVLMGVDEDAMRRSSARW